MRLLGSNHARLTGCSILIHSISNSVESFQRKYFFSLTFVFLGEHTERPFLMPDLDYEVPRIKPETAGQDARTLPLCYTLEGRSFKQNLSFLSKVRVYQ